MDYSHYRPDGSRGYMIPACFAQLCCEADQVKLLTPVSDGVHDRGIL